MSKKSVIILLSALILLTALVTIFAPILYAENLTDKHFDEFSEYMYSDDSPIRAENMKILKYSDNTAKVYYYTPNRNGDVLSFTKTEGVRVYDSWDSYWSVSGNTDRIVWPYWWHCIYFLFL